MDAKPLLFDCETVQKILDGRKTAFRIVARGLTDIEQNDPDVSIRNLPGTTLSSIVSQEPYSHFLLGQPYKKNDILFVKEAWAKENDRVIYKATYPKNTRAIRWRSSPCMRPKDARLFLKVKEVTTEKVHDILLLEILDEGIWLGEYDTKYKLLNRPLLIQPYIDWWDRHLRDEHKEKYCFNMNPWTYFVRFEIAERPKDFC